jgi:predicted phage terminase large subunit-like protein
MTQADALSIKTAGKVFKPQEGGQTMFLSNPADVIFYGGQAGGGKTYALLLGMLRHIHIKSFNAVIFRREMKQIKNAGGLWDESCAIYPHFGGKSNLTECKWVFPSGATISFSGLELEQDKLKWQGAQIAVEGFDEITHFSDTQVRYMMTRNRSMCGIRPYIRATCNPDPDSWVKRFVEWYLTPEGTPDKDRRGIIRYFGMVKDEWVFGESLEYMSLKYDLDALDCRSFTFIYATLEDNPKLLEKDPGYVSNLKLAGETESAALLYGNWNIKKTGKMFKPEDFKVFTQAPLYTRKIIVADTAQKTKEHNDYSVFQCWIQSDRGIYLIDQVRGKYEYPDLEVFFMSFINKHRDAEINVEDAVSGTSLIQAVKRKVQRPINAIRRSKDKYMRAFAAQGYIKSGYVFIDPMAEYRNDLINELCAFSADGKYAHDDQADCMFDAVDILLINPSHTASESGESLEFKPRIIC